WRSHAVARPEREHPHHPAVDEPHGRTPGAARSRPPGTGRRRRPRTDRLAHRLRPRAATIHRAPPRAQHSPSRWRGPDRGRAAHPDATDHQTASPFVTTPALGLVPMTAVVELLIQPR